MHEMTTRRPYLIRAFNEWILDNGMTPYLSINAEYEGTDVPGDYIIDGEVVLNISPNSVRNLELGQEFILFDARFSGRSYQIVVPVKAVLSIFAKENGEGMAFVYGQDEDEGAEELHTRELLIQSYDIADQDGDEPNEPPPTPPTGRPRLKIVK